MIQPTDAGPLVKYDFQSPEIWAVHGLVEATVETDSIPLRMKAGLIDDQGDFQAGAHDATLTVRALSDDIPDGVGVLTDFGTSNKQIDHAGLRSPTSAPIGASDSIRFIFDERFVPETVTLNFLFFGETFRIFEDGARTQNDLQLDENGIAKAVTLSGNRISYLDATTFDNATLGGGWGQEHSDYFVASIEGHMVPEPSEAILIGLAIAALLAYYGLFLIKDLRGAVRE